MDWKLSLAGLFVGLLVGMTGMGGGSLMTPMLVFLFGFKPTVAIGTDILHGAIFKSFGAVRHRQLGTVHARLTLWMLLGSAPFSLVGVALSTWLARRYGDGFEEAAAIILGIALIAGGIGFAVKTFVTGRAKTDRRSCSAAVTSRLRSCSAWPADSSSASPRSAAARSSGSDAARLPAHGRQGRRYGHLPRGRAALGRGRRPSSPATSTSTRPGGC